MTVIRRYGAVALLWIGLFNGGGKTPLEFSVWGIAALGMSALALWNRPSRPVSFIWELVLASFLGLAYALSQDKSFSLFFTVVAFTLILLWYAFKTSPDFLPAPAVLYQNLAAIAIVVLLRTCVHREPFRLGMDPAGLFPINPIFNAMWMVSVGAALTAYALGSDKKRLPTGFRVGGLMLVLLMVVVVMAGPVRSALSASVVAFLYVFYPWASAKRSIAVLAVLVPVLMGTTWVAERMRVFEVGQGHRSAIEWIALRSVIDHPLTGLGLGNFEMAYHEYAFPVYEDPVRYARSTEFAHNEWLQLAAEGGLPLAFLTLFFFLSTLFRSGPGAPAHKRPAKAALLALAVSSLTNITWHLPILLYMTLLWAAVLFCKPLETTSTKVLASDRRLLNMIPLAVCFALILLVAQREAWANARRWDAVIRWMPWDALGWHDWANAQPDLRRALEGHARSVALAPTQLLYRESYASALESTHQPSFISMAKNQYEAALVLSPTRASNVLAVGRTLFLLDRTDLAHTFFRQARCLEPNYWEADLWIARCLSRQGRRDQAEWTLGYLIRRRELALEWNRRMESDLNGIGPHGLSGYEQTIMGYDPTIVQADLTHYLTERR